MFKKVFLAFGIISSANAALLSEDNRVFIGAQIGSSWVHLQEKTSSATTNHNHIYANYGILYGYEIYFGDAFGVRDYQMVNIVGLNIVEFGAGADIIWNLAQASQGNFGLIFGGKSMACIITKTWLARHLMGL